MINNSYYKSYTEDEISNDIAIQRLMILMPLLSTGHQLALKKAIKALEKDEITEDAISEEINNDNPKKV